MTSELLKRNYSVIILDNLSSGKRENLKGITSNSSLSLIEGDIRSQEKIKEAFQDADSIIHLAALVDIAASVTDPSSTNDVNVNGTLNVLQEATRRKCSRFVFASSTAIYGDAKTLPINEEATVNPISPYAASKLAGEAYCKAYEKSYGLSTILLRFFNVYGPRSQSNAYSGVITKFLQQAKNGDPLNIYGDGEQTRDFIHVRDVVEALILALEIKEANGEIFNVCTGIPTSINKLAQAIQVASKKDLQTIYAPARLGEIKFSYGDKTKAQKKLGFKAKISLIEGLNSLIDH